MGARNGNKLSSHTSEDSISCDSLSFACLVSQEQQPPKPPSPPNQNKQHYHQVTKQDQDFEFSTVKPDSNSATSPFRITPADVLISNGQIKPHAIVMQQSRRPFTANNAPISLRSLLAVEHIRSNLSSGQQTRKYHEQLAKTRNHKSKEKTETRTTWFGQKVFRSFLSPCRKCQAVQPDAVKAQNVTGEKLKMY